MIRASGMIAGALDTALESVENSLPSLSDPGARAEALLSFLHARILKRCGESQTRVDRAVLTGEYNCVSSAVLYAYLAKKAGLSVSGVRTPDHALCVVDLPGRPVDVETTNRYGFDPGSKKEFQDSFGRITGYAYVPPGRKEARRGIGDREFLGLILSNRIAELELQGRWDESVGLAFDYDALVGSPESRPFLLDRISNFEAGRHARNDWDGAFSALTAAAAALGPSPRLAELEALTARAALSWFGSRRDWDGGQDYSRRLPPAGCSDPTGRRRSTTALPRTSTPGASRRPPGPWRKAWSWTPATRPCSRTSKPCGRPDEAAGPRDARPSGHLPVPGVQAGFFGNRMKVRAPPSSTFRSLPLIWDARAETSSVPSPLENEG